MITQLNRKILEANATISNLNADGEIWGETSRQRMYKAGNKLWHTDSSFKRLPSLCSLLYSRTIAPIEPEARSTAISGSSSRS